MSDSHGGIAWVFPVAFSIQPDLVHSDLVKEAEAAHPNHDDRSIATAFTIGAHNAKADCLPGDVVSDDPNDSCNRYDGVLRYKSYALSMLQGEKIPGDAIFKEALATWQWTK